MEASDNRSLTSVTSEPVVGCGAKTLRFMKTNLLLLLLILSLVLGIVVGVLVNTFDPEFGNDKRTVMYFRFPGEILMRMLRMIIIPLIVSSLISGLASLDSKASGKMGLRTVVYYLSTTFSAVVLGIILVVTIRPGDRSGDVGEGSEDDLPPPVNIADSFLDLIRNMLPDNLIEACFRQTKTDQIPMVETTLNETNHTIEVEWWDFAIVKEDGMNILGLVVYSVATGIIVSRMGEMGKPIGQLCDCLAEASMRLVVLIIWYSPIGIMFLVAAEIVGMEDPIAELQALGLYMATVLLGLFIHGFVVLPLIYFIILRKNPFVFLKGVTQAMVTAFGTASSSATLPVTYKCLEQNLGVDRRVTRFVLPVGATINMDGTALYEAVAAIFIAQLEGIELNAAQIIAASITATFASIGAASVPQAGIVTMVIVLTALGLPSDSVAKILAVDWLLDRFRTAINVEGDSIGAGIIYELSKDELAANMAPLEADEQSDDQSDPSTKKKRSSPPPSYDGVISQYDNSAYENGDFMTAQL